MSICTLFREYFEHTNMIVAIFCVCFLNLLPNIFNGVSYASHVPEASNQDIEQPSSLPTDIEPVFYKIKLHLYSHHNHLRINGSTKIKIKVSKPTKRIVLHAKDPDLYFLNSYDAEKKQISNPVKFYITNNKTNLLIIYFEHLLLTGQYQLLLRYRISGKDHHKDSFHPSQTDAKSGRFSRYSELIHVSDISPCWNEPKFKAHFKLIVTHDKKLEVLSNTYVAAKINGKKGEVETQFVRTPKMSTHSVAIVVLSANLKNIESQNGLIHFHAPPELTNKLSPLLDLAEKTINFMNNYTEISYESFGLGKLDIILVPETSTNFVGMSIWGIIFLQEELIKNIYQLDIDKYTQRHHTDLILQCIHQWIGNLITIDQRSYIWFQRSMAIYLKSLIVEKIEPRLHIDEFVMGEALYSFMIPKFSYIVTAPKMNAVNFMHRDIDMNPVVYLQAAHSIRTFGYILGDEKFRLICRDFLKKHAYHVFTYDVLIDEFAKTSDINDRFMVKRIFQEWLFMGTFLLLHVNRNYETHVVSLHVTTTSEFSQDLYLLPINYVTEGNSNFNDFRNITWMSSHDSNLQFKGFQADKWVLFNKQQFGSYMVNYDERNWELIIKTLKSKDFTSIHVRNRAQLIHDAFYLLEEGKINPKIVLSLVGYLEYETDIVPWISVLRGFWFLRDSVKGTKYMRPLEDYIGKLSNHLIDVIGFKESPNDSYLLKIYRNQFLFVAHRWEFKIPYKAITRNFEQWLLKKLQTSELIEPITVGCYGVEEFLDEVWNEAIENWTSHFDAHILTALACLSNSTRFQKLMSSLIEFDRKFHSNLLYEALRLATTHNLDSMNMVIDLLEINWSSIREIYTGKLRSLIESITKQIFTQDHYNKLKDFVNAHDTEIYESRVQLEEVLNDVHQAIRGFDKIHPDFEEFFFDNNFQ